MRDPSGRSCFEDRENSRLPETLGWVLVLHGESHLVIHTHAWSQGRLGENKTVVERGSELWSRGVDMVVIIEGTRSRFIYEPESCPRSYLNTNLVHFPFLHRCWCEAFTARRWPDLAGSTFRTCESTFFLVAMVQVGRLHCTFLNSACGSKVPQSLCALALQSAAQAHKSKLDLFCFVSAGASRMCHCP